MRWLRDGFGALVGMAVIAGFLLCLYHVRDKARGVNEWCALNQHRVT